MYIGSTDYSKIYVGSSAVNKVYKGTTQIYSATEAETIALLARMSVQPNDALKALINTTIKFLKDGGVWNKLDCLYFRNVHDVQASTLNWIKNAHNSTIVNAPRFWQFYGFWGNGSNQYLNNNYIMSSDAVNVQSANHSVGVLDNQLDSSIAKYRYGALVTAPQAYFYENWNPPPSTLRGYIQTLSYANNSIKPELGKVEGYTMKNESGRNNLYTTKNGIQSLNRNDISITALPTITMYECALNSNGTASNPILNVRASSYFGASLTEAESVCIADAMLYFNNNIFNTLNYGPELVINGGFDADTDWTKTTGFTILNGKAVYDDVAASSYIRPVVNIGIETGVKYKMEMTISDLTEGGNAFMVVSNHVGTAAFDEWQASGRYLCNGTHKTILTASANILSWRINAYSNSSSSFKIDNVSFKRVL